MKENIFSLIRTKYNTLSPTQKNVADYVLSHSSEVILLTLNDLADACNVSETTIIRFLRKLSYNSYQVFRVNMAQSLEMENKSIVDTSISQADTLTNIMNKVRESTLQAINDSYQIIDKEMISKFLDMISSSKKIVVIGVGASSCIAMDFYHKLLRIGLNVIYASDPHFINMITSQLTYNDLLISISHSGESREILDAVLFAKEENTKVAAITSYAHSTLSRLSNCFILSSSQETQFRSDAMTSRIIQLVIIDIIYTSLVIKIGDNAINSIQKSREAVSKNKT